MGNGYFARVKRETKTRLWVNNPTVAETDLALKHGAVCCTTNPTYGSNMLRRDREFALSVIDDCLGESENDSVVAELVQQRLAARILKRFRPVYEETEGALGYLSIQGDPFADIDAHHIVEEARRSRAVAPNVIAKIPVTAAGRRAICAARFSKSCTRVDNERAGERWTNFGAGTSAARKRRALG